jgi:hypothetical protein
MDQFIALSQFWPLPSPLVIGEDLAEAADRIGTLRRATKFSTVVDRSEWLGLICMSVSSAPRHPSPSLPPHVLPPPSPPRHPLPFPPLQESAKVGNK